MGSGSSVTRLRMATGFRHLPFRASAANALDSDQLPWDFGSRINDAQQVLVVPGWTSRYANTFHVDSDDAIPLRSRE